MEDSLIGLYGGTFNPIHFGHISLAISLQEQCQLSQVWFIPNNCSPFRMDESMVSPKHRLKMVELAIESIKSFKVLPIEVNRKAPSYTIETITQLQSKFPKQKFALMLSEEVYKRFNDWHKSKEILNKVELLIGSRSEGLGKIKTPNFEISGTKIRERLQKGLYCGHLVPGKVLDYISENQLYSTS